MRRGMVSCLAVLIFATLAWAGGDPWKTKPYKQWDDKDIQRILSDSPWSREIMTERTWISTGEVKNLPTAPIAGHDARMPAGPNESEAAARGGNVGFYFDWMSSRVIREAYARQAILHQGKSAEDEEKYIHEPLSDYAVGVTGRDMTPFFGRDEKVLMDNAFLQTKKTKQKVLPTRVAITLGVDGKTVTSVTYFFQKRTASGDPEILPDEKNIEFVCKLSETTTLKADFEPQKMLDQMGPNL
jgi:hypothetical protein